MADQRMEEIKKLFCERVHLATIEDDKPLAELGLDSLDVVEMCMDLEDRYGFSFSPDDLGNLKTVGDLLTLIERSLP